MDGSRISTLATALADRTRAKATKQGRTQLAAHFQIDHGG